ncbi:hypothetical protein ACTHQ6_09975 [Arthrobacter sp. SAFR-179]|uniref:hypothetical protein n=1 Tax=Arthrobacter sp. SAFR-179 TaxID=3387279 RepID=UPI003F7B44CE
MTVENESRDPAPVKPMPASIIGAWFRDPLFWQGVTASTLSTAIVAAGAVVAALLTGLVDLKAAIVTLLSIVAVISVAAILIWLIPAARSGLDKFKSKVLNENAHVSIFGAGISAFVSILGLIITHFLGGS